MNTTWKTRTAWGLTAVALTTMGWTAVAQAGPPTQRPTPPATATATADAALTENLTFMRQEEQLARDVYNAFAAKYPSAPQFANIAKSEQRHFDAMGRMLDRYGIPDPADGHSAGSYADPDLQALYKTLLATGSESLAKAYEVGITIETEDIADLKAVIAETTQADAKAVFTNLLNGSGNHLAAFTAAKDGKRPDPQGMRNDRAENRFGNGGQGGGWRGGNGGQGAGWAGGNGDRPETCPFR